MAKVNSLLKNHNVKHINVIADHFNSLSEVSQAVKDAGLESSNLIFGKCTSTEMGLILLNVIRVGSIIGV